jgi:hypothetical protein
MYPPLFPDLDWEYVPIHIVNDGVRIGLPPHLLGLFQTIENIAESENFIRSLNSMPVEIRNGWSKVKSHLSTSVAMRGLDFKEWNRNPEGVTYSVRVSKGHRAHIRLSRESRTWMALDIGTHSQMGHG